MATVQEKPAKSLTKTAFVKSFPSSMPAKMVVEKAKKAGMTISDKYVYVVRSNARRKPGKKRNGTVRNEQSNGLISTEREFRRLVLELGVRKSELLLSELKKSVAALIAGN